MKEKGLGLNMKENKIKVDKNQESAIINEKKKVALKRLSVIIWRDIIATF